MNHDSELGFLCSSFEKCRLKTRSIPLPYKTEDERLEYERLLSGDIPETITSRYVEDKTLYKHTGAFGLRYRYFKLSASRLLVVGPYLSEHMTEGELLELCERNGITPQKQHYLSELYLAIPILEESCSLFTILDVFLERLWDSPAFQIVDREEASPPPLPINEGLREDGYEDALLNMRTMEQRYAYENEMIEAVTLGQIHKEGQLFAAVSGARFEKRVPDVTRNAKNYAIIMNTLLRKAAERGGVHPVHLDRVSSDFARRIEQQSSVSESDGLMVDMFRSYCRLVRKHSMRGFTPLVQKTMLIIDSDLASELTLSSLARAQGVSPGYLATIFKRETSKTVSEYVRERRIKHAEHLLRTTDLQIQTIALHCGILDVQYFSKLFKRECGTTPKEYRNTERVATRS